MASTVVKVDMDAIRRVRNSVQEQVGALRKEFGGTEQELRELVEGNHGQGGNWWEGSDADEFKESLSVFEDIESDIKYLEEYREILDKVMSAYYKLGEKLDGIVSSKQASGA